jgi:RNA-binding protein
MMNLGIFLTSRQRAYLRALGHSIKSKVYVGREGISPNVIEAVEAAYHGGELVKLRIRRECPYSKREAGDAIAQATGSCVVQVLGNTVLLYRPNREKPGIVLPE